jgi:hypothetical protein
MGEMADYISLSQHFRQIKEMGKTTVSSSWETDSGLGDSPPSTPGYHAHCMPFRLEEGEQQEEKEQQEQKKELEEQQEEQEQEEGEKEQEEKEEEMDEQSEDYQTDWKNLLVFPGKASSHNALYFLLCSFLPVQTSKCTLLSQHPLLTDLNSHSALFALYSLLIALTSHCTLFSWYSLSIVLSPLCTLFSL